MMMVANIVKDAALIEYNAILDASKTLAPTLDRGRMTGQIST